MKYRFILACFFMVTHLNIASFNNRHAELKRQQEILKNVTLNSVEDFLKKELQEMFAECLKSAENKEVTLDLLLKDMSSMSEKERKDTAFMENKVCAAPIAAFLLAKGIRPGL